MIASCRFPEEVAPVFEALALSPDPVFITDRHNKIVFINRSATNILGYSSEEAVGASCAELLAGSDMFGNRYCSDACPVTQMARRGETVRQFGLRLRAQDNRTVLVDVSILHFRAGPADDIYLAHIIRPSRSTAPSPAREEIEDPPPRPTVLSVKESPDARARKLTGREVEVLGMLAAGRSTPEIAERLHIAGLTARNHIQNILDKLEVHSKAEAVAFAFQKRLL